MQGINSSINFSPLVSPLSGRSGGPGVKALMDLSPSDSRTACTVLSQRPRPDLVGPSVARRRAQARVRASASQMLATLSHVHCNGAESTCEPTAESTSLLTECAGADAGGTPIASGREALMLGQA